MQTVQIHECAEPGCGAQTIYGYCSLHEPEEQHAGRQRLQVAMADLSDAEEAWVALLGGEDAVAIHTAEQRWRAADARVNQLEREVGMERTPEPGPRAILRRVSAIAPRHPSP